MRIIAYIRTLTSRPACAAGPAAAQRTPCTRGPGAPLQRRPGPHQSSSRRTSGRRPRNSGSHTRRTALAGPGSERMGGTCAARTQSAPAISACCIAPAALPASASRRTGRSHTSGTGRRGGLSAGGCTACIRIRRRIGTFVPSSPPSPALCSVQRQGFCQKWGATSDVQSKNSTSCNSARGIRCSGEKRMWHWRCGCPAPDWRPPTRRPLVGRPVGAFHRVTN